MPCYTGQHRFYCGVDLHARTMFVHVLDRTGKTVFAEDLPANPDAFLAAIKRYRKDLVVGVECMFAWYWVADLCEAEGIPFALGHALAMKHLHGGKSKSDRLDAAKLAALLRGGLFPLAYAFPKAKRHTRDLLRHRAFFVRRRAQLLAHVVNTNTQFNLPPLTKKLTYVANRTGDLVERFADPSTKVGVAADLALIDASDERIAELERYLVPHAKVDDAVTFGLLRTVPGIGQVPGLTLMYEVDDIARFSEAGHFLSYARLVRWPHESAGKVKGRAAARRAATAGRGAPRRPVRARSAPGTQASGGSCGARRRPPGRRPPGPSAHTRRRTPGRARVAAATTGSGRPRTPSRETRKRNRESHREPLQSGIRHKRIRFFLAMGEVLCKDRGLANPLQVSLPRIRDAVRGSSDSSRVEPSGDSA